jgi:hypothetical protein
VQQLRTGRIDEELRERAAIRDRERVHEHDVAAVSRLHEAQLRVVRALAHELGVEREGAAGPRSHAGRERRRVADGCFAGAHRHLIMRKPQRGPKAA